MLHERRYRLPLQALEPVDLDGDGTLTLTLLNPTGGICGGDTLDTCVVLGAGSRVCLTTPAASRVYRTVGPAARQTFAASVGDGAVLEYVPDHLIPSPGARLVQRTDVVLANGATAILVDGWVAGRIARGEQWRFAELDLGLSARDERGWLVRERSVIAGRPDWERLGATDGRPYAGTLVALSPARTDWDDLTARLGGLGVAGDDVVLGATPLARGGVLARVLARSAPGLRSCLDALWAETRRSLLGLGPLDLRKL
ncbi:MAG: urease accessory protein UreD [Candidatus Rokuibacteriota bacterium]